MIIIASEENLTDLHEMFISSIYLKTADLRSIEQASKANTTYILVEIKTQDELECLEKKYNTGSNIVIHITHEGKIRSKTSVFSPSDKIEDIIAVSLLEILITKHGY